MALTIDGAGAPAARVAWRARIRNSMYPCIVRAAGGGRDITILGLLLVLVDLVVMNDQNEKNKVSSTLLSLRLDAQPTVTY